ncbi:hypothetical protein [Botrimarina hoheduenensis]|uniref:PEP-CTERM protein-sorting domain-containing protein n=1 Tax=Botrimarina hoheduenensis TaxID=2528000 RepID=A0A5C5W8K7_9BACT|nr:hypothetical protein [Botrimarina hoheduenensis]TWT47226.1 hypothetical protein Pla111_08380 [Botrimarina hoheduenensis]
MRRVLVRILVVAFAPALTAGAQPVVDGRLTGDTSFYGPARSIQNTNTQYGNATNGDPRQATGGSEIDAVYAAVVGDRLHVLVAGNLESNYNKLSVFIDSEAGGMNQVEGAAAPAGVDPFCCPSAPAGAGALQGLNGLRFDTGFAADHFVGFSNGPETILATNTSTYSFSAYYGDLTAGPTGRKSAVGFQRNAGGVEPGLAPGEPIDMANNACSGDADVGCTPNAHLFAEQRDLLNDIGFRMAIDNSNTQGVNGGSGAATGNPQAVMTGIEFSIPLAVLGSPTTDLRLVAFIGNSQYSHLSNQFSGVGVLQGNLGAPVSSINLAAIAGEQFVTIPHASLAGDFNYDGLVDTADYTLWRDGLGAFYTANHYDDWVSGFAVANDGAAAIAVPEPTTSALLLLAVGAYAQRLRSVSRRLRVSTARR